MRRSRVLLAVAFACLLLALGLVCLIGPHDKVETLMRRSGRPYTQCFRGSGGPSSDRVTVQVDLPEGDYAKTDIFRGLSRAGWLSRPGVIPNLYPPPGSGGFRALFPTKDGKVHVIYSRLPSRVERLVEGANRMLGMIR